MKVESIIRRDGGTKVVLGATEYHFAPDATGKHVCEVKDRAHIARFLSIAEGYQLPDEEDAASEDGATAAQDVANPNSPARRGKKGATAAQEVVAAAGDEAGQTQS